MSERSAAAQGEPVLVADAASLAALLERLADEKTLAIDTEGNSFYAYVEKVCLIQIGAPGKQFIVDPLAVDVKPLAALLTDPARLWVVHGGDFDVRTLRRDFGFQFGRLFDTMIAAQTLQLPELGLAALLKSRFGLILPKAEQRSDWGRRPLRPQQLSYGASDVRHLIELERILRAELIGRNLLAKAEMQFEKLRHLVARERRFDREGYQRLRGARGLSSSQRSVLAALWVAREALAQETNRPPFKVLGEAVLVEIARRMPVTPEALRDIPGLSELARQRIGPVALTATRSAQTSVP